LLFGMTLYLQTYPHQQLSIVPNTTLAFGNLTTYAVANAVQENAQRTRHCHRNSALRLSRAHAGSGV
jgi:uncharacterized protein YlzI (FlbEa/FlbD family)